ncbi:MAG: hypothetical protein ABIP29_01235, partial [Candidatus Eisenbacteria bacterium]
YLERTRDPTFGTTLVRIAGDTGAPTAPVRGTWGADARHVYSKQQPWNADGTLLLLQNRDGGSPSRLLLDGRTYEPRAAPCAGDDVLWDYRWHPDPAHAGVLINVDKAGRELSWYDVTTCRKVRAWTLPVTVDYGIGSGEGNPSQDGRYVALGNDAVMFVVDMAAPAGAARTGPLHRLVPCDVDRDAPAGDCRIGNLSISPSGRYVDVKFKGRDEETKDLHRIFAVDPRTLALRPHAMAPAALRCGSFAGRSDGWIFPLKHADLALDPFDGNEDVIVGGRSCAGSKLGRVVKVRLRDGKVTALSDPRNEASVSHVSTRNLRRPGWAYVGYFRKDGKRFSDEIVALKLDGSGAIERLAHKHAVTSGCYRCESHPVPSPDGRRVLFASNWAEDCAGGCGDVGDIKAYVLETAQATTGAPTARPRRTSR